MSLRFCYITAADRAEALRLAEVLIDERLAACANVLDGMTSVYRWQGRIERAAEAVLIVKTTAALVPRLVERVNALHSYECPCLVALPIEDGNPAFLEWIAAETMRP